MAIMPPKQLPKIRIFNGSHRRRGATKANPKAQQASKVCSRNSGALKMAGVQTGESEAKAKGIVARRPVHRNQRGNFNSLFSMSKGRVSIAQNRGSKK
jgi:hypothetical protein